MFYSRRSALPSRAGSIVAACAAIALAGSLFASPASAANPTVTGRVVDDERPLSDASVTLKGPHVDRKTVTNGAGTFTFPDVPAGRYHLAAVKGNRGGEQDIDVSATGVTNVMIEADPLSNTASETPREIGHVATRSRSSSGTSVSLTGRDLAHNPAGDDLSKLLLQMPATVRGANGRVDVNGQRNGIGYVIDGVPVPAVGLSTQIDPDDLSGFTVTEGAYSARIGDPYGAVVQAETIPPSGATQLSGNVKADTLGTALSELGYHLPLPRGGCRRAQHAARAHRSWLRSATALCNPRQREFGDAIPTRSFECSGARHPRFEPHPLVADPRRSRTSVTHRKTIANDKIRPSRPYATVIRSEITASFLSVRPSLTHARVILPMLKLSRA